VKYHKPVPSFGKNVSKEQIEKLVKLTQMSGIRLPVIETIRQNNCEPVMPKSASALDLADELFRSVERTQIENDQVDQMNESQTSFYSNVIKAEIRQCRLIEQQTRMQSKNACWFREREYRLTSSTFGTFCRLKPSTDPVKTFKQKKMYFTSRSVKHGIMYEDAALAKYCQSRNLVDSAVGLVVNPQIPFLGASPDRLVLENEALKLIEIKCPYSLFEKKTSIDKQIKAGGFYLQMEHDKVVLRKNHDYFYQIQGQLNICGIDTCDLVVFVPPEDTQVVTIKRDQDFFNTEMLPKMSKVWFQYLMPHFLN